MRRILVVLIAVVALLAALDMAVPPSAEAQSNPPIPRLRLDPECIKDPGTTVVRVRGSGFGLDTRVRLTLAAPALASQAVFATASVGFVGLGPPLSTAQSDPVLATVNTDGLGTFDTNVTIQLLPALHSVTSGRSFSLLVRTVGGGPRASVFLPSNCSETTATADAGCNAARDGRKPKELTIRGQGFEPGEDVIVHLRRLGHEFERFSQHRANGKGRVRATFDIRDYPPGDYSARVVGKSERSAYAWFQTPCPRLDIRVRPDCARVGSPPGRMDVAIVATGFHEDRRVWVIWDGPRSHEFWNPMTDDDGRLVLTISPYRRGPGTYTLRIRSDDGESAVRQRSVSFTVPCEPTTASVKQRCARPALQGDGGRQLSLDVSGTGFEPGNLSVIFDADEVVKAESFKVKAGADGKFSLKIDPSARPLGSYRIVASQRRPGLSADGVSVPATVVEAETSFVVPCRDRDPSPLTVAPVCGPDAPGEQEAYEIAVGGNDYYPNGRVFITFDNADRFAVRADRDGAFSTVIRPTGASANEREERRVPVRAQQRDTLGAVVAGAVGRFLIPCPIDPSIAIAPEFGPAGYTTLVTGHDFRPGTMVTLTWDRGIEAGRPKEVEVGEDGSFEVYVFILPHDWPGERTLTAGLRDDPDAFDDVSETYLVTLGPGVPPGASGDGIVSRR